MSRRQVISIRCAEGMSFAEVCALADAIGIARPPILPAVSAFGVRETEPERRLGFVVSEGGGAGEGGSAASDVPRTAMRLNVMRAFDGTKV